MKKLFTLLAVVSVCYSCKKSDNSLVKPKPVDTIPATISVSNQVTPNTPIPQGNVKYNLLGYGYDVTGAYADISSVRTPAINIDAFITDNPYKFSPNHSTSAGADVFYGKDAADLLASISNRIDATTGGGYFKTTITAAFASQNAFDKKYTYAYYSMIIRQQSMRFYPDSAEVQKYVTPEFSQDVKLMSAADLVKKYGTHILTNVNLGARFDVLYQAVPPAATAYSSNMVGFTYALKRIFGLPSGQLDPIDKTVLAAVTSPKLSYKAIGGDVSKLKQIQLSDRTMIDIDAWSQSSTFDNAVFIGIGDRGLTPLYILIADASKYAEVKQYIDGYLATQQVK